VIGAGRHFVHFAGQEKFMKKPPQALHTVIKAACATTVLAAFVAMNPAFAADVANGKLISDSHNCAACHGVNLNNPIRPDYPKLAGQHGDYIYWALRQYQMGTGNPNLGRNNAIMAAQVQNLSPSDMQDVAAYIESLKGDLVLKK
jgi:cytochrome c553